MKKKQIRRIAVIAAVIILPLLYSFFYLYAFWDPYSKLENLPVAVVNEDKGANINGTFKNAGNDLVDELKKSKDLKWVFTDKENAAKGLTGREYYAEIYIPQDFTEKISTADKKTKVKGLIVYRVNEKRNFLAGQILNKAMLELKQKVSSSSTEEIVNNMVVEIKKVPDNLQTLNDGIKNMYDGSKDLTEGIYDLKTGQIQLNDGIKQMDDGLKKLADGSGSLVQGTQNMNSGVNEFSSKLNDFGTGEKEYVAGNMQLYSGIDQLKSGFDPFYSGLNTLSSSLPKLTVGADNLLNGQKLFNTNLGAFKTGVSDAVNGVNNLYQGAANLKTGTGQLDNELQSGKSDIENLVSGSSGINQGLIDLNNQMINYVKGMQDLKTSVSSDSSIAPELKENINQLYDNSVAIQSGIEGLEENYAAINEGINATAQKFQDASTAVEGINQGALGLYNGLGNLKDGITRIDVSTSLLYENSTKLLEGSSSLSDGIKSLSSGVSALGDGASKLNNGVTNLYNGSKKLSLNSPLLVEGVDKLCNGTIDIKNGASQLMQGSLVLKNGISDAASGASQLNSNAPQLLDGENKLYDGSNQLKNGLNEANGKVSDSINEAKDKSANLDGIDKFASTPVDLKDEKINSVPDYGTAFAPYFMSLSLWVGAILIFIIIYLDPNVTFKRDYNKRYKDVLKFLGFSFIGIAQAVLLVLVVEKGLGLKVKDNFMFFITTLVVSLSFISVVQFFIVNLKDIGKFLSMLMLILQLTACAGTFPIETVPKLFKILNPFMPMTYSVAAWREAISGVDYQYLYSNLWILVGIMVVFLTASIIWSELGSRRSKALE